MYCLRSISLPLKLGDQEPHWYSRNGPRRVHYRKGFPCHLSTLITGYTTSRLRHNGTLHANTEWTRRRNHSSGITTGVNHPLDCYQVNHHASGQLLTE